jgi:hypothetical protein
MIEVEETLTCINNEHTSATKQADDFWALPLFKSTDHDVTDEDQEDEKVDEEVDEEKEGEEEVEEEAEEDEEDLPTHEDMAKSFDCSFKLERLTEARCEDCDPPSLGKVKQKRIMEGPEILYCQIQHFAFFDGRKSSKSCRINEKVDLSNYQLQGDLDDHEVLHYRLVGMVMHLGADTTHGHYTAIIKEPTRRWVCLNDSKIMAAGDTLDEVLEPVEAQSFTPYLLFYMRTRFALEEDPEMIDIAETFLTPEAEGTGSEGTGDVYCGEGDTEDVGTEDDSMGEDPHVEDQWSMANSTSPSDASDDQPSDSEEDVQMVPVPKVSSSTQNLAHTRKRRKD